MITETRKKLPEWAYSENAILAHWEAACQKARRGPDVFFPLELGDRLNRLFAVAVCRSIWSLITDDCSRTAVEVAERFADGGSGRAELYAAFASFASSSAAYAHVAAYAADASAADNAAANAAISSAVSSAAFADATKAASSTASAATFYADAAVRRQEWRVQGLLLVCIVGPGWEFDPAWRTDTAVAIARGMYESRDFSAMPILADALQDAGCEEAVLLDRLRDPGALWCRGCRILDELLGKR